MTEEYGTFEQKTLDKLLHQGIKEQRSARRWNVFFKILFFAYLFGVTGLALYNNSDMIPGSTKGEEVTAVIPINGQIGPNKDVSAKNIIPLLRKAFENKDAKAIILQINSPGGTPTQAHIISKEMDRLRAKNPDKKVYAVIEDVGASGAYWLASAADKIYADESSMIGSIGVVVSSFGFVGTMEKIGVERRLYTAGESKGMLDPFTPSNPAEVAMLEESLKTVHDLFISQVKNGRGDRLIPTPDMFSGRIWLGIEAIDLGLIDGFGDVNTVSRDIIEAPELLIYKTKGNIFSAFTGKVSQVLMSFIGSF